MTRSAFPAKHHFLKRQHGLTLISFLLLLGLIGFFCLLVLRIGPIYFDHFLVRSTLESLNQDPDVRWKTREEILQLLKKRWDINNIDYVKTTDVKITREEGTMKLQLQYDVRRNVFGNLDVLVHFDDVLLLEPRP